MADADALTLHFSAHPSALHSLLTPSSLDALNKIRGPEIARLGIGVRGWKSRLRARTRPSSRILHSPFPPPSFSHANRAVPCPQNNGLGEDARRADRFVAPRAMHICVSAHAPTYSDITRGSLMWICGGLITHKPAWVLSPRIAQYKT